MLLYFIGFIVLSVAIMTGLIYVLQHDSVKTITEIGNIYMEGISDKNVQHFETIVETRLDQLAEIGLNEDQADMQKQGIGHFVYPRFTHLTHVDGAVMKINDANKLVIQSKLRNQQIIEDVTDCVEKKRTPLLFVKTRGDRKSVV